MARELFQELGNEWVLERYSFFTLPLLEPCVEVCFPGRFSGVLAVEWRWIFC